jgi:molecular chaperone HscB
LLRRPQTFDLDETALSASFKRLQRTVHPDHFAGSSGPQQALSAAASSSLNVAFAVLADPASRAQYILKLAGRDAIGEASSAGVSPELLAQVMEAREVLMEAGTSAEEVLALQGRTADALRACLADLRRAFATGDLALAASIVVALQYYSKLSYECGCWLDAPPPVQGKGA